MNIAFIITVLFAQKVYTTKTAFTCGKSPTANH